MDAEPLYVKKYHSPAGELLLGCSGGKLRVCDWTRSKWHTMNLGPWKGNIIEGDAPVLTETARQLDEYFAGERKSFNVHYEPVGTEFQRQVWKALESIGFGSTANYRDIARLIGRPSASRAVGSAIGRNPLSIIIPCHRVLPVTGTTGNYAGGAAAKELLLRLEGRD